MSDRYLALRTRAWRRARGLTRDELAAALGCSVTSVKRMEDGVEAGPQLRCALLHAFGDHPHLLPNARERGCTYCGRGLTPAARRV